MWLQVDKQAKKRWPDRILALAYGAAGFNGSGTIGCRGVPVSQMLKEAVKQFRAGRVVLVDEFRTSRVSSADNTPVLGGGVKVAAASETNVKAIPSPGPDVLEKGDKIIRFYDWDVSAALNIRRCVAADLDVGHVEELKAEAAKQRRLLALEEDDSLQDTVPLPCRMRHAVHLEEDMEGVSMERHGRAKQLVVFFGAAGIGTGGGWGADAVLQACCKVVCRPRGTDQRRGRVLLVDEPRTSRVSSAVNGQQPCERQLNKRRANRPADWKPPVGQVRPAWSQQRDQPVRGLMWCPVVDPAPCHRPHAAATQPAASEPGPSTPSPAQRSKRIKAEPAAEPTQPTKGKVQGKAAKAKPIPQPGRPGLQCSAEHAAHWGEQVARAGEAASRGQGVPWPGLQAVARQATQGSAAAAVRCGVVVPSSSTSLEANLKHIAVTLAIWDVVWEMYLDPKWAQQRLRLYGAQDWALELFFKKLEEVSMKHHKRVKQLVVFSGAAGIGTRPRGTDQRRRRVVLEDESRTSWVSSTVDGQQLCESWLIKRRATRPAGWKPPAGQVDQCLLRLAWSQQRDQPVRGLMWCPVVAPRKPTHVMWCLVVSPSILPQIPCSQASTQPAVLEPGPSTPLPAKRSRHNEAEQAAEPTQPTKGKGKAQGKAAKAKPAPQPGRWVDRDCNAALNMQRIGESRTSLPEPCPPAPTHAKRHRVDAAAPVHLQDPFNLQLHRALQRAHQHVQRANMALSLAPLMGPPPLEDSDQEEDILIAGPEIMRADVNIWRGGF
ncbi:hypothetical protein QJQ45_002445 [Haematococcus lacustris]|nr:hypothetical protein QJQ45_002445 [Haematococcus lacustris]